MQIGQAKYDFILNQSDTEMWSAIKWISLMNYWHIFRFFQFHWITMGTYDTALYAWGFLSSINSYFFSFIFVENLISIHILLHSVSRHAKRFFGFDCKLLRMHLTFLLSLETWQSLVRRNGAKTKPNWLQLFLLTFRKITAFLYTIDEVAKEK